MPISLSRWRGWPRAEFEVQALALRASLADGTLTIDRLDGSLAGSPFEGPAALDGSKDVPSARLRLDSQAFDLGALLGQFGIADLLQAKGRVRVALEATGDSPAGAGPKPRRPCRFGVREWPHQRRCGAAADHRAAALLRHGPVAVPLGMGGTQLHRRQLHDQGRRGPALTSCSATMRSRARRERARSTSGASAMP